MLSRAIFVALSQYIDRFQRHPSAFFSPGFHHIYSDFFARICYTFGKSIPDRQVRQLSNPFETLGVSAHCTPEELRAAYRKLARRWHPDRFLDGPEREWANQHMTEINAAYAECTALLKSGAPVSTDDLDTIRTLIQCNRFSEARKALLHCESRGARWNYFFGFVLQKQGESDKALTYLNLAVRQEPKNAQYIHARDTVQRLIAKRRTDTLFHPLRTRRS